MAKCKGVKCFHCQQLIKPGDKIIKDETMLGAYCGILCWALERGRYVKSELTNELIEELEESPLRDNGIVYEED